MSPHTTKPQHRVLSGAFAATALITPLIVAAPASAAPCTKGDTFSCNWSGRQPGGGGGGGNPGGGGGPSGPVEAPDPEGLNPDEGIGVVPVGGGPAAPAAPTLPDLIALARSQADLPVPVVHTAPRGKTYVRFRTSLWVENVNVVKTNPIGDAARQVQAIATPKNFVWNMGEKELSCEDAGSPNGKSCSYTYQRSSAGQPGGSFKITATIIWDFVWTCKGSGCGGNNGGSLGVTTSTSVPTPLIVSEIQTNTGQ